MTHFLIYIGLVGITVAMFFGTLSIKPKIALQTRVNAMTIGHEIHKTLTEYAPEPPVIDLTPRCRSCRGPLVDGRGEWLPLPISLQRRMPIRARARLLNSLVCCHCADCGICIEEPSSLDVTPESGAQRHLSAQKRQALLKKKRLAKNPGIFATKAGIMVTKNKAEARAYAKIPKMKPI